MADLPRTIHFIAQAPVLYFVWFGDAILASQIAPARALFNVAIFHQGRRLFGRSGSQIEAHERQSAHSLAPRHEFIGTKLIGVDGVPRLVQNPWAILFRPDAVKPVVTGYKITARVTNDRHS